MIKKSIHLRVVGLLLVVLLLSSLSTEQGKAATGINNVTVSNVRDNTFVVSWTTTVASNGSVTWSTSVPIPPGTTVTDSVSSTTTHYVTISGLLPSTTYYFQVTSGDETDNNNGTYYTVTTGPSLLPPSPANQIRGFVYLADGSTIVPNAMVYLQIQDVDHTGSAGSSQWISARAGSDGRWSFTLSNARTSNLASYFSYTAGVDKLQIIGQGGSNGTYGIVDAWIIPIPTASPATQNVILYQEPTDVLVYSFTGLARLGSVQLDWKTATEVGLVGFNVYRSDSIDGAKTQLNSDLLPAQNPGQMTGASYQFSDTVDQGQHFYYWLELVLTDGAKLIEPLIVDTHYWIQLPAVVR